MTDSTSSTNRVYLVRHGQSVANVQRVFSNLKVDLPLTERIVSGELLRSST